MGGIPVRDGVPLKYIIRANNLPDITQNKDFLGNYKNNTNLMGKSFTIDTAEVHTCVVNLIDQNEEAESIIRVHENKRNRRKDWKVLKYHYEGIVVYSNDITKSDLDFRTINYTGEKKPIMWWIEFERRLCLAYQTYVKHEEMEFHSDQIKLRTLLEKVTCDWLGQIK